MANDFDVIVIGAGITGLSAANALVRAGRKVMVLEAANRPGGRMTRLTRHGDAVDAGPQQVHDSYAELLEIIDLVGLKGELRPMQHRVQYLTPTGAPVMSYSQADTARLMGLRGTVDLAQFYLRYFKFAKKFSEFEVTRDIPEYDNVSALEATAWAGKKFQDFVLRPMTYAMTNTRPEYVNLYQMIGALKLRLTTQNYGLTVGILGIAEHFAKRLPVTYGKPVRSLIYEQNRVKGVLLADGRAMTAAHVIIATEAGGAAPLIPDEWAPAKRYLTTFTQTPMPLVFFFLDRPAPSKAVAYMGHPYRDAPYNMALDHAQRTPWLVPSGKGIVSAWPSHPLSSEIIKKSDTDITRMALADMEAFVPGIANWVEEARVVKHHWGCGRPEVGFHRKVLDFKAYTSSLRGVSFAGNDYDGVHMESGVRSALRAVARAIKE
jgi:protoporphyrinogen/coproporphyrinogen III oxidase